MKENGVSSRQHTSLSAGIEDFCETFERTVKPVVVSTVLISHLPEARGLCFAQYFFCFFLYWFMPSSGGYGGTPGIFGDKGAGHARASGGWLSC